VPDDAGFSPAGHAAAPAEQGKGPMEGPLVRGKRVLGHAPQQENRRQHQQRAQDQVENDEKVVRLAEVPADRPNAEHGGQLAGVGRGVGGIAEDAAQGEKRVGAGEPARLGADEDWVAGLGVDGRLPGGGGLDAQHRPQGFDPIEQNPADQEDHDDEVKREDRPPGAHLEGGDGHGDGPRDQRRDGGDAEAGDDRPDGHPAEDLRDREDRDPADQQRDDKKKP
jgi:hypothetical protein